MKLHGMVSRVRKKVARTIATRNPYFLRRTKRAAFIDVTRGSLVHVSKQLESYNVMPVIWMGYSGSKALKEIKERYKTCDVIDYWRFNKGASFFCGNLKHSPSSKIILSPEYKVLKDKCIKVMDRLDQVGHFRFQEREALFYSMFCFFYSKVIEKKLDFIVSAHSPHLPAPMVFYGVCEILGIKTVHVREIPNAPFSYLAGNYYGKNLRAHKSRVLRTCFRQLFIDDLKRICSDDNPPHYMVKQRETYQRPSSCEESKAFANCSDLASAKTLSNPPRSRFDYEIKSIDFLNKDQSVFFKAGASWNDGLDDFKAQVSTLQWSEYNDHVSEVSLTEQFVYFPLHYEPEKTSNPDGGNYYNSYEALMAVRNFVPSHIPIYVKEHITQFHKEFAGYKGRSAYFYRAMGNLPNIRYLDSDIPSSVLIEKALFTISQTGTACLEAACRGRKAVLMGSVWFSELPNVYKFDRLKSISELLDKKVYPSKVVVKKAEVWLGKFAVNGYVTGSFIRMYENKHPEGEKLSIKETARDIVSALRCNGIV